MILQRAQGACRGEKSSLSGTISVPCSSSARALARTSLRLGFRERRETGLWPDAPPDGGRAARTVVKRHSSKPPAARKQRPRSFRRYGRIRAQSTPNVLPFQVVPTRCVSGPPDRRPRPCRARSVTYKNLLPVFSFEGKPCAPSCVTGHGPARTSPGRARPDSGA